jgi:N-acetylmuramoyl-L-alanine amidase
VERGRRVLGVVLTLVLLGLGAAVAAGPAAAFTDVSPGEWYEPAVAGLAQADVVAGFDDGSFRPNEGVTRAQFAAMLYRALKPPAAVFDPFVDVADTEWCHEAVAALYAATLVAGVDPDHFAPDLRISRQQAATLLGRSLAYSLAGGSGLQPDDLAVPADQVPAWLAGFVDRGYISEAHAEGVAVVYRAGVVAGYDDGRFFPTRTLTRAQAAVMIHRALFAPLSLRSQPPDPVALESAYPTLSDGSQGDLVMFAEAMLAGLTYRPGSVDGVYDSQTEAAVMAFQKVEGLARTGVLGAETWDHLLGAGRPALRYDYSGNRMEVDLSRQVMFYVHDGALERTYHVSTGRDGMWTPTGRGTVYSKQRGWQDTWVGSMYSPSYIFAHIAVHGMTSVPNYNASHGCVRVPMWQADEIFDLLPMGTSVYVYY